MQLPLHLLPHHSALQDIVSTTAHIPFDIPQNGGVSTNLEGTILVTSKPDLSYFDFRKFC
jgi:hypothetical protein